MPFIRTLNVYQNPWLNFSQLKRKHSEWRFNPKTISRDSFTIYLNDDGFEVVHRTSTYRELLILEVELCGDHPLVAYALKWVLENVDELRGYVAEQQSLSTRETKY